MIFANKKIATSPNQAKLTAKIIANVKALASKNLIAFEDDTVFLYPSIWKDKISALNWIKCLYLYCCVKRNLKDGNPLYFKNIESKELIGTMINKTAKVLMIPVEA